MRVHLTELAKTDIREIVQQEACAANKVNAELLKLVHMLLDSRTECNKFDAARIAEIGSFVGTAVDVAQLSALEAASCFARLCYKDGFKAGGASLETTHLLATSLVYCRILEARLTDDGEKEDKQLLSDLTEHIVYCKRLERGETL